MNKEQARCTTNARGDQYWNDSCGDFHRIGAPAIIYQGGDQFWYKHGKLHRLDGPAVEYVVPSGQCYYIDAVVVSTTPFELSIGQTIPWPNTVALVIKQINPILFQILVGNKKIYLFSIQ